MKKEKIKQILQIMEEHNISINEIVQQRDAWEKAKFDLLCCIQGEYKRIRYDIGKHLNPIGIFPTLSNAYLLIGERDYRHRSCANESRLIPKHFWAEIFTVINSLNKALEELEDQKLDGDYFVKQDGCSGNLIVNLPTESFIDGFSGIEAKTRYWGLFNHKN